MRRAILILALSVALLASAAADEIAFSGGSSSIVLREGRENVILSDGASVTVGSMEITADTITLYGEGWTRVECSGHAKIVDDERGISIETEGIYYDREEERILISSSDEVQLSWGEVDLPRVDPLHFGVNIDIEPGVVDEVARLSALEMVD